MNRSLAIPAFVLFFVIAKLLCAAQEAPSDWQQFRGPDRTGVSKCDNLLALWPNEGPPLVWRTQGAGRGYSSVSIFDGKLYTMGDGPSNAEDDDEYLQCFDASNGEWLFNTRLGAAWNEGPEDWQSSRSTPTIDGTRIYALTAHADLVCVDARNGQTVWRKNLRVDFDGKKGDGWGYSESVLVDGDLLICTPGGDKNTMVALKKQDGSLVWSTSRSADRGAGHASVVISHIGDVKVYVQSTASGAIGVRAADGRLMWSYEIDQTTAVIPTVIVRNDLVFFTVGYGRGSALLRQTSDGNGGVAVEEIYPLNKQLSNKHGGVVLVGNEVYGDSEDSGIPFCADLMTGERKWKERGSGKGSASITAADGHLYVFFSNGVLALVKASPDEYNEVSSFEIPGGSERPSWAHPVITDGKIFLRNGDEIFCFDLRAKS